MWITFYDCSFFQIDGKISTDFQSAQRKQLSNEVSTGLLI